MSKAPRAIPLLNCLGSMVEKVAAELISAHCEAPNKPQQYGGRSRRSAADAVSVAVAQIQEVWRQGKVAGALLMYMAAAFPSVGRGCLLRNMRGMQVDESLVQWFHERQTFLKW